MGEGPHKIFSLEPNLYTYATGDITGLSLHSHNNRIYYKCLRNIHFRNNYFKKKLFKN